jgi:hypothetical protein
MAGESAIEVEVRAGGVVLQVAVFPGATLQDIAAGQIERGAAGEGVTVDMQVQELIDSGFRQGNGGVVVISG